jgi:hypothetical protein
MTGQLSGPIVPDKLFFLVNAQRTRVETDPSGPRTSEERQGDRWNGRLTWDPRPEDHATLSVQHHSENDLRYGGSLATDELALDSRRPETSWNLQWRHLFGARTFLEARYLGWTTTSRQTPQRDLPRHIDVVTGQNSGAAGFWSQTDQRRHQASVSVSRYAEAFGRHDLKFGMEIERGRVRDQFGQSGERGVVYFDYAGQPYLAYSYSFDATGRTERESVYAQDGWRPTDRLTLNLGGRLDRDRGKSTTDTVYKTRGLAPRLGLALDVGSNHRAVVRASFGRYYETLPVWYFWPALKGIGDGVLYANTGADLFEIHRRPRVAAAVDPKIRQPRVDEFALGFERALGKDIRFSVTGIARRSVDFIDAVHPRARFEPVAVTNPLTGAPLTVYSLVDPSVLDEPSFITNVDGLSYLDAQGGLVGTAQAFRKYRGLMIVASRRLEGRWQAQLSYVLAKAEGTVDNGQYDGLGPFGAGALNYGSATVALVNAEGRLSNDYRHELKVLGSYRIPRLEVGLNAYFRVVSGTTYTPNAPVQDLASTLVVGFETVPLEPRGSRRLPVQTILDLRIEKTMGVGRGRIGVYVDITNVLNASTPLGVQDRVPSTAVEGYAVPFGAPLAILPSRQATLGARWSF